MQQLTPEGQRLVADLAQRHGFSPDAVTHMLFAVLHGNGSMAQFNHPEFAGSGQWMQGGMMMLGDMFNHSLKGRVDALCNELSNILANQPGLLQSGSFQSQSQSGGGQQQQNAGGMLGESSLFVPDPSQHWWPRELGQPNATGSQNNVQYAYFAGPRRLAVKTGGQVWVYDTLDHQIGGFSQQQGVGGSILFTSQYGTVVLSSLPVVSIDGVPQQPSQQQAPQPAASMAPPPAPQPAPGQAPGATPPAGASPSSEADIFNAIERLGKLRADGLLTEEEFAAKKAELLGRL
ncbi:SHOCT domain-containing protein [uncultured Thiohalocapsa sp.]|uniref:SHOCT domain-containing protein n=1 Tax=uncultured Thiohalocapsa sp. TaxID=768990 RepID=UPI0025FCEAB1|nr:SHOCT domain-containing protein [uncultured Thiohalocapsa sp.]